MPRRADAVWSIFNLFQTHSRARPSPLARSLRRVCGFRGGSASVGIAPRSPEARNWRNNGIRESRSKGEREGESCSWVAFVDCDFAVARCYTATRSEGRTGRQEEKDRNLSGTYNHSAASKRQRKKRGNRIKIFRFGERYAIVLTPSMSRISFPRLRAAASLFNRSFRINISTT